jgi:spore germination protein
MRLLRRVAAGVVAGIAAFALVSSASVCAATAGPSPRRFVTGWVPYWAPDAGLASVTAHASLFTDASPFWFTTTGSGAVVTNGSASSLVSMSATLHARGVQVIPTVTSSMSADVFARLLNSRAQRRAEVRALRVLAQHYGVDGLDLDFESINSGSANARATVLAKYPLLTAALHSALAADGRLLSITLPARTSDDDPNWAVYDYARLGATADRLRIMTYDYHWGGGSPGPIAPRSWVRQVLTYAVTRVARSKISFGLPSYGRDWYVRTLSGRCPAAAFTSVSRTTSQMQAFAQSRGIAPQWSPSDTSRTFTYIERVTSGNRSCRVKRVAWYDDARSVRAKVGLVRQFGLRGVAFWALGYESPGAWRPIAGFGARNVVQPATLRGHATPSLSYGRRGVVVALLSAGRTPVAGATLTLQRQTAVGGWRSMTKVTTRPNGRVRALVRPYGPTTYRFVAARGWARTSAVMTPTVIHVHYAVSLATPPGRLSVSRGAKVHLQGTVQPGAADLPVRLQAWNGKRWMARGAVVTDSSGNFTFTRRFTRLGRHRLRFVVPAGELDRGVSASLHLRIT